MAGRSTGLLTGKSGDRRVPLRGKITHQNASACIARLVLLAVEGPQQPIVIDIDSPGGLIKESMSILSTMNGIKCPVATFCHGIVGGTAAIIAAHGLRGFRTAAPHCVFNFKPVDAAGKDLEHTRVDRFHQMLADILAQDTRQSSPTTFKWLIDGVIFDSRLALENGLIDAIATKPNIPKLSLSVSSGP